MHVVTGCLKSDFVSGNNLPHRSNPAGAGATGAEATGDLGGEGDFGGTSAARGAGGAAAGGLAAARGPSIAAR